MVYESSGMMASLLGASFEAFVADNEMLGHVYRLIRGVEVDDETLAFDAIREAVTGEGHFLGSAHTIAAMQRDYYYPPLADRDDPRTWEENGAPDFWTKARDSARQILATHHPDYLDPATDAEIRRRYKILIPPERLRPAPGS